LSYIHILRQLVDRQQFELLASNAEHYFTEQNDIQALPLLALASAHIGDRASAEQSLQRALGELDRLDSDARVDLAAVHCLQWRIDLAIELLLPVLEIQPEHALALARLAWCRMQEGELEAARRLYQRSAALMPDRLPVWSALVRLHLEAKDTTEAQSALMTGVHRLEAVQAELPEPAYDMFVAQFRGLQLEIWVDSDDLAQAEEWLEARRSLIEEEEWCALVISYASLLAGHGEHAAAEAALRDGLTHYTDHLALISQLAELAQVQGRSMQAIQLLRRLIKLAPEQDQSEVPYWVRLSNACLHQFDDQARRAAEKATELVETMIAGETTPQQLIDQLRCQAQQALADVENQAQNFELAESIYQELLTENRYFLPALQGLGQLKLQLGQIDEAVALFERVKEIDPAKGYASLINVRRFPKDVATLERIEKSARQPSMEGEVRGSLLLQLASAWEKQEAFDQAFAFAVEANDSMKKILNYDPVAHRQSCARIRYAFCKELYQHRPECGNKSDLPLFVVGMPRSGTTLVEQIIASHSQIFGAGELGVISSRVQGLNRWERHSGSGRQYPDCVDDLSPYVVDGISNDILMELQELAAADKPNAKHVVDKLPHNFEHIGLIKFLFPNARIISVRRDPRDIAISNFFTDYQAKHGGMGFAYDLNWIGEQLADHNLLMHHWQQLFPGQILEVNYEDVVDDLEGSARKMLDYIGVDWEPQVLAFNELDRPVKTASVWQVRQPIYKTSKAKWARYSSQLAPLIAGTNRRIEWEPIEMVSLPEPGLLNEGVALYNDQKLDEAEYAFKKLLHHIPDHAAANFMVGIIYAIKGLLNDAIVQMEKGFERCPWNANWRKDLIQAYEMAGEQEKADLLKARSAVPEYMENDCADGVSDEHHCTDFE